MNQRSFLLPLLLLAACGPIGGTEVGNPDLVSNPKSIQLAATCAGGIRRTSVSLQNESPWWLDAVAGGRAGEEAYPSIFGLERYASRDLALVIHVPAGKSGAAKGKIEVRHRRLGEDVDPAPDLLEIPWRAPIAAAISEATILCGGPLPCAALDFGDLYSGLRWQLPFEISNDGCAPLQIERIDLEGDEAELAGPPLPAVLQAGESWRGDLLLAAATRGRRSGAVVVVTDEATRPVQSIPWSATIWR